MSSVKRIQFAATINAPLPTVWHITTSLESYKRWASAFMEGCYFEGSWDQGAKIRFLARTFVAVPEGTKLVVDLDVTAEFEQDMKGAWPKALTQLEQLCEAESAN